MFTIDIIKITSLASFHEFLFSYSRFSTVIVRFFLLAQQRGVNVQNKINTATIVFLEKPEASLMRYHYNDVNIILTYSLRALYNNKCIMMCNST